MLLKRRTVLSNLKNRRSFVIIPKFKAAGCSWEAVEPPCLLSLMLLTLCFCNPLADSKEEIPASLQAYGIDPLIEQHSPRGSGQLSGILGHSVGLISSTSQQGLHMSASFYQI
jgi:hypothetical protein